MSRIVANNFVQPVLFSRRRNQLGWIDVQCRLVVFLVISTVCCMFQLPDGRRRSGAGVRKAEAHGRRHGPGSRQAGILRVHVTGRLAGSHLVHR